MKYTGLRASEVSEQRRLYGANVLTELPPESLWRKIWKGFRNPMIVILLVAMAIQMILFFFGKAEWYEFFGILVAIAIANGVAAVFEWKQEGRASLLKHEQSAKERAKVLRDGVLRELPFDEIVTADLLFLQAGDKIPADGVLLEGALKVDQSALNGESEEAPKHADESAQFDGRDLLSASSLYRGTVVCAGEGYARVSVVGDRTLFGEAALAAQEPPRETPLQLKLAHLANKITLFGYVGAAVIVALVLGTTVLRGNAPAEWSQWLRLVIDAVTVAVTIIVCAVPEGLPMLSSLLQALQSLKMVRDNVLVRKINGLETAGSLSILFCDKTGTITEGRLSVVEIATADGARYETASGMPDALRRALVNGIGVNNSAVLGAEGVVGGNGTDRALLQFLLENGLAKEASHDHAVEFRAFDSVRKSSAAVVREEGLLRTYVKGAPERLLERCTHYLTATGETPPLSDFSGIAEYLDRQAARSMRLLAVAMADGASAGDMTGALTLVCVVCIRDNVRKEASAAIREISNAGIQVVMVTGDRKETALAIARDAGLISSAEDVALSSSELAQMSDDDLRALLPRLRVVSRALPLDKSRLVRIAQQLDYVVGMTGDGVNDAPALRLADVGFAMGSGTEVAKDAGEITILDDNLASIEKAILYGRTMFRSIRKFLLFQLTVNVAAVVTCAVGPLFGVNVVMTVIQLLLVNLAMDTLAAIAYGSEPPLAEYMRAKPVPRSENIVTRGMLSEIGVGAGYISILCLAILFLPALQRFLGTSTPAEVSSALFATFMMAIAFNGFHARTTHRNPFHGLGSNPTFLLVMGSIFALQFLFVTFGGKALAVTPLSIETWLKCITLAFLVIPVGMAVGAALPKFWKV